MSHAQNLNIYLHPPIFHTVKSGKLGFINRMRRLLEDRGWQVDVHRSGDAARAQAPDRPGYALYNMEKPTHPRALTFRLAYHYPYWRLEPIAERWRWPVARAAFDPGEINQDEAREFAAKLRNRVLPGTGPQRGDYVLVPLQGRILEQRSFQFCSPLEMIAHVACTGRPTVVTLHPKETYNAADRAALDTLLETFSNLSIQENTTQLLRDCAYVATQNSGVAFDGYILGKPAVLFAQVDFHHIALNVADIGVTEALSRAGTHQPDYACYLDWFLRRNSLDMMAEDADDQMLEAMRRGGWPV